MMISLFVQIRFIRNMKRIFQLNFQNKWQNEAKIKMNGYSWHSTRRTKNYISVQSKFPFLVDWISGAAEKDTRRLSNRFSFHLSLYIFLLFRFSIFTKWMPPPHHHTEIHSNRQNRKKEKEMNRTMTLRLYSPRNSHTCIFLFCIM